MSIGSKFQDVWRREVEGWRREGVRLLPGSATDICDLEIRRFVVDAWVDVVASERASELEVLKVES